MLPVLSVIITPYLLIQLMLLQSLILMSYRHPGPLLHVTSVVCFHHSSLTHTADVISIPEIDVITDIQDLYYMLSVLSVIITPHLQIQLMLLQSLILMSLQTSRTFYHMLPVLSVIITPHLPIQLMLLQSLILMSLQTSRPFITCYQCCLLSSLLTYPYS